jgi:hypothetical protein
MIAFAREPEPVPRRETQPIRLRLRRSQGVEPLTPLGRIAIDSWLVFAGVGYLAAILGFGG